MPAPDPIIADKNASPTGELLECDDFGLKIKKRIQFVPEERDESEDYFNEDVRGLESASAEKIEKEEGRASEDEDEFKDAHSTPLPATPLPVTPLRDASTPEPGETAKAKPSMEPKTIGPDLKGGASASTGVKQTTLEVESPSPDAAQIASPGGSVVPELPNLASKQRHSEQDQPTNGNSGHVRGRSSTGSKVSEWSHQHQVDKPEGVVEEEDEWQEMPAYAPYDIYDDDNRLVAREAKESDEEDDTLGGAGKGYTRVQLDEDAQSATSLDENTQYLFKESAGTGAGFEDEEQRDAVSQMQATKDLLTEGQRIAYVGMTRLVLSAMLKQTEAAIGSKKSKKETSNAAEALQMWSQKMMVRLYAHMDISTAEQVMIEQLDQHGVVPSDLRPTLMQNARVKNPMAEKSSPQDTESSSHEKVASKPQPEDYDDEEVAAAPPPYQEHEGEDLPEVRTPSQLPTTANLDIDLRWTVLCDLFLTLIADSVYDARSRVLLEKVGENMDVSLLEICRFEKRVTDALEMQQAAEKENWNEDEHKENRRKMALKKRYIMMGLATVGGSLVIGLSAGLLAPVIGAGLAAGFTTIGVAGTSGFLAGAGGAAIITSGAAASGGIIAVRAANRRTGAVKTFEYRPLHNNKRVNLIVTVSGWMTGKVDDVRLPYSTVDPIMGDIYSVLWEPEMLTSMGDTINILATEALTQGLQQVLGSTLLIGLMAALQLPVVLTKLAYLIDNPWSVSLDRANSAGLILADSLIDRNLGTRPITLVGYSLGSRVIFSCLQELARKGAYGLVQNVYLFGSPIVTNKDEYLKARSVVAGRFLNGYATNDWILAYLFRLTSGGISRVAGIGPVEDIPGLENINVTEFVPGHMSYRTAMPRLLREIGWEVESDEFTEIEDPDPENHQVRQRELINELEEARKEFEQKQKEKESKGKFGWLSRRKKGAVEKKEWEMYQESKSEEGSGAANTGGGRTEDKEGNNHGVLFDIDAIRAELASEHMEVKELKSTLPALKLDLKKSPSPPQLSPKIPLRSTKSYSEASSSSHSIDKPLPRQPNASEYIPRMSTPSSEYIPGRVPTPNYGGPAPKVIDDVEMTFDTAYESPPPTGGLGFDNHPTHGKNALRNMSSTWQREEEIEETSKRPELRKSMTLPAEASSSAVGASNTMYAAVAAPVASGLPPVDLSRNAWADDDEDFGQEKEIEMTFA